MKMTNFGIKQYTNIFKVQLQKKNQEKLSKKLAEILKRLRQFTNKTKELKTFINFSTNVII